MRLSRAASSWKPQPVTSTTGVLGRSALTLSARSQPLTSGMPRSVNTTSNASRSQRLEARGATERGASRPGPAAAAGRASTDQHGLLVVHDQRAQSRQRTGRWAEVPATLGPAPAGKRSVNIVPTSGSLSTVDACRDGA